MSRQISHYHCVYNLKYHLVLVTKYRRPCLNQAILQDLEAICQSNCQQWEIELLEFGGEADHIHLLLAMHPNITPSKFINNLKTVSSRLIRKAFSEHLAQYYSKPGLWTRAYCLITAGGAPIETLKQYIQNQAEPQSEKSLSSLKCIAFFDQRIYFTRFDRCYCNLDSI